MLGRRCIRVFLAAALSSACTAPTDVERIAKLEAQNEQLQKQVASVQRSNQLDAQAQCAKDARTWFSQNWRPDRFTMLLDYRNHFSASLNKCFIQVEHRFSFGGNPAGWNRSVSVHDVYENMKYGQLTETHRYSDSGEEVTGIFACEVLGKPCQSVDEYSSLTVSYLTN